MRYRPLGRTGLMVSEIGYGAWGIGGSGWIGNVERNAAVSDGALLTDQQLAVLAEHRWERNVYTTLVSRRG